MSDEDQQTGSWPGSLIFLGVVIVLGILMIALKVIGLV